MLFKAICLPRKPRHMTLTMGFVTTLAASPASKWMPWEDTPLK